MQSIYDWVSIGIFAGLIVLFLQRSTSDQAEGDASIWYYLVAGVGCAAANYFGNQNQDLIAILLLAGTLGFIVYYLKPFRPKSNS